MYNIKLLLTSATLAFAMAAGTANAASWDYRGHGPMARHELRRDFYRPYVTHARVIETLRAHHYREISAPVFVRGHYVVRSHNRFGRDVFVRINPYSGAFIGEIRL